MCLLSKFSFLKGPTILSTPMVLSKGQGKDAFDIPYPESAICTYWARAKVAKGPLGHRLVLDALRRVSKHVKEDLIYSRFLENKKEAPFI